MVPRYGSYSILAQVWTYAPDGLPAVRIDDADLQYQPALTVNTVDPASGTIPDVKEPLATLDTFRRSGTGQVMFAQNIVHRAEGILRAGDVLAVGESSPSDRAVMMAGVAEGEQGD